MVTQLKDDPEGVLRWQAIKQSLLQVTAIFLATLLVVALSTGVQKAAHFINHSAWL
ncbi:MAG: hypothetical protein H7835_18185 [Magnetococcus sp. XQGC-1]